jgi:cysteine desulfurase / selenocysteine lyase
MDGPTKVRQRLREEMPISLKFAYFDHAAVSPIPAKTSEAILQFASQATHEGDTRWLEWSASAQKARSLGAAILGAAESEVALVANTTTGIGIVAEGFPWQPGDNIVVPDNEFPSNLLPWRNLLRRGVEVRLVPMPASGEVTAETLRSYLDSRTRIVSVSWVGFLSGFRCDLAEISQLVHGNGSLLFVDAIQGLGAFPINVHELDIDFLSADGHKWMLGPEGAGLLYIREKNLDQLAPIGLGWNSLATAGFDPKSVHLKTSAAKFEGGSSNLMGMIALGTSLSILHELGTHQSGSGFHNAILENVEQLNEMLLRNDFQTTLPVQPNNRSGILGIRWPNADAEGDAAYVQARKHLLQHNVVLSVRGNRLRAATHAYNTFEDHSRLVDALVDFRKQSS